MAGDLHYLELTDLAARIRTREVSPVAVTRALLDRIAAIDGTWRSYATVMPESAMADAQAAETEIGGPLSRAAARRSDRGEGLVLDQGRRDRGRDANP